MFFYNNIHQNLYILVLILCFIFNILLPIYKHVFFNPKQLPKILYLSIILESLKNTVVTCLQYSRKSSWLWYFSCCHCWLFFFNTIETHHGCGTLATILVGVYVNMLVLLSLLKNLITHRFLLPS